MLTMLGAADSLIEIPNPAVAQTLGARLASADLDGSAAKQIIELDELVVGTGLRLLAHLFVLGLELGADTLSLDVFLVLK